MEVKIYSNIWKQYVLLSVGLIFSLPITSHAFWGVNSLDEKNDLKFKSELLPASAYASPNATFEKRKTRFNSFDRIHDLPVGEF